MRKPIVNHWPPLPYETGKGDFMKSAAKSLESIQSRPVEESRDFLPASQHPAIVAFLSSRKAFGERNMFGTTLRLIGDFGLDGAKTIDIMQCLILKHSLLYNRDDILKWVRWSRKRVKDPGYAMSNYRSELNKLPFSERRKLWKRQNYLKK